MTIDDLNSDLSNCLSFFSVREVLNQIAEVCLDRSVIAALGGPDNQALIDEYKKAAKTLQATALAIRESSERNVGTPEFLHL